MKKKTVLMPIYGAISHLEKAVVLAARSDEVSDRQRERVAFLLRTAVDIAGDLRDRNK